MRPYAFDGAPKKRESAYFAPDVTDYRDAASRRGIKRAGNKAARRAAKHQLTEKLADHASEE